MGRGDEAIAVFEEAILADYENCENHLHFATYLMRLGKTGRAQTEFMEAKRFCEGKYDALIYRNLAVAGIKLDKRDLARQYVEEGLRRDANDPYLNGLKGMLVARENPVFAESLFVKARSLGEASPEFLVQYGLLLINEGRPREAADVLEEASRLRPGEREIAVYLAEALDRAGDYAGARVILDELLAAGRGGNPEAARAGSFPRGGLRRGLEALHEARSEPRGHGQDRDVPPQSRENGRGASLGEKGARREARLAAGDDQPRGDSRLQGGARRGGLSARARPLDRAGQRLGSSQSRSARGSEKEAVAAEIMLSKSREFN